MISFCCCCCCCCRCYCCCCCRCGCCCCIETVYLLTDATVALWEVLSLPDLETLLPFPAVEQDRNIVLVTQYYRTHETTQRDIDGALVKNLANPHIKEIYLLTEVTHLCTQYPFLYILLTRLTNKPTLYILLTRSSNKLDSTHPLNTPSHHLLLTLSNRND